jgi:RNA polymerase sigma factor (sigma-70 family)
MPNRATTSALGQLHKLLSPGYHLTDEQLLQRFVTQRDESAFAALFKRHGPMVLGVCLSVLRHTQDAEDACQASFLVLARKAASIRARESVASWLHGVTYRLARKLEATRTRKPIDGTRDRPPPNPIDELNWREVRQVIHVELQRLPRSYQLPLILCYLEGQTQDEAAKRLGWTAATLKGRLDRGRDMLRRRLTRRGLALEATLLATVLIPGSSPAALAAATVRAAMVLASGQILGEQISAQTIALVQEGIKALLATKLKMMAGLVLTLGLLVAGAGWAGYGAGAGRRTIANQRDGLKTSQSPPKKALEGALADGSRVDFHGDPLPGGAVARIGTTRFLQGNRNRGNPIAFTRDGRQILSIDSSKAVVFWDAATGKEARRLEGRGDYLHTFVLSPDGKILATVDSREPKIRLWNVATGKEIHELTLAPGAPPALSGYWPSATFAPDGMTFAASMDDGVIRRWDTATWQPVPSLPKGGQKLVGVDKVGALNYFFLPDGKTFISANDGIQWLDISTDKEIRRLDVSPGFKNSWTMAVSPDGSRLAALVAPNVLYLWNAATGAEISRSTLDSPYLEEKCCLCFSPDSQRFAFYVSPSFVRGSANVRETMLLDADTGKVLRRWGNVGSVENMAFSPDGKALAQCCGDVIDLRDPLTGKPMLGIERLPDWVLSVGFAADGKSLITGCRDGRVFSWDSLTGKLLKRFPDPPPDVIPHPRHTYGANFTADGTKASLMDIKCVRHVWDTATGKILFRVVGENEGDHPVFSPDGKILVVKDHSNWMLRLWDVASGTRIRSLQGSGDRAFSTDGSLLATTYGRGTIRIWEVASGNELNQHFKDSSPVHNLAFSPDGKRLISVEGTVISPDGKTLAKADRDAVVLWETATGKVRARFFGHRASVYSLAFSPDGRRLASGSADYTAIVWDATGVCPGGKLISRDAQPEELDLLWADLGGTDAARAHHALWTMVAGARQSVSFLAERLSRVAAVGDKRIARLIMDLDSEDFKARTQASKELAELGHLAEPALSSALAAKPSLELRQRANKLLDALVGKPLATDQVRVLRALEALEQADTPDARKVLETLAKGPSGARLTTEAQASLKRVGKRGARAP